MPNYDRIGQIQKKALKQVSMGDFFGWIYQQFDKSIVELSEDELDTVERLVEQGIHREEQLGLFTEVKYGN